MKANLLIIWDLDLEMTAIKHFENIIKINYNYNDNNKLNLYTFNLKNLY